MGDTLEGPNDPNGISYPEWQPEFVAAITETDPVRLKEKIAAAEFAIFQRAQKLAPNGHEDEREAMRNAASALRGLLISVLGYPDSTK